MINDVKDPQAVLIETIDWIVYLNSETISVSDWSVPAGLTGADDAISTTQTRITISGGTSGCIYDVKNTITTNTGRIQEKSILIWVREDELTYGTPDGVATLTPRYANATGYFDTTTRPTMAQVARFIGEMSGIANLVLARNGFSLPVTEQNSRQAIDAFIEQEVASICEGINGSGRFGPTEKSPGKSRFGIAVDDFADFLASVAAGMERLGAGRQYSFTAGLAFRDTDESGNATAPIFQRSGFGNVFEDWDAT